MYRHRLFSTSFALIIGIAGLIGLLVALALPAAAKPIDDWPAVDLVDDPIEQNRPAMDRTIEAPVNPIDLPTTKWRTTLPPTRSLSFRRNVSAPYQDSLRSSTSSALTIDGPRSRFTEQDLTNQSATKDSPAPLAPLAPPMPGPTNLAICLDTDRVWGVVSAGDSITVAVNNQQMGASPTDAIGFFWTTLYNSAGNKPGLTAGNVVTIYHGTSAGVTLRSITAQINLMSDIVSGTIGGVSSPMSVTVYATWESYEPSTNSISKTVSTDASGKFSANFSGLWDFTSADSSTAVVAYSQNGLEVHRHVVASTGLTVRPTPFSWVFGTAPAGSTVTVTLFYSDAITLKEASTVQADAAGGYFVGMSTGILDSDVVIARFASGAILSRTVDHFTEAVDAVNDRVTGEAKPGQVVKGLALNLTSIGQRAIQITTTANASGVYTINFSGKANILPGQWVWISLPDAQSDDLDFRTLSPSIDVNQTYDVVSGFGAGFGSDGIPVTVTVYSASSATSSNYYDVLQQSGEFKVSLPVDIVPGDVVTASSGAWQGVVQVMTLTVLVDPDVNQFTGTVVSPTQRVELSGNYYLPQLYPLNGQFALLVTATSPFTAAPGGFDVRGDLAYDVAHLTAGDYFDRISRNTDDIGTVIPWNTYGGIVNPPGSDYTVTLYNNSGTFKAQSASISEQPNGGFWQNFDSSGQRIEPGDHLQLQSAAGFSYTAEIPNIVINPDLAANVVSGYGPANALLLISVDNQGQGFVPTDGSGHFVVALNQLQEFWGDGDLKWGENIWVTYYDANNAWLVNVSSWPYINPTYFMDGYNQVNGSTPFPANPIYITVTHPVSGVIATATTTAGACDWCGPNDYNEPFPIGTVVPGNSVTVDFGDGYTDTVDVVALTGYADPATEILTGTAPANGTLDIGTGRDNDWTQADSIAVDASGYYTVDFAALGWDIRYGDQFKINYRAPHGHSVTYIFDLPAPDVSVNKWNPSGGYARPGGVMVYALQYSNGGTGDAENTIITDTLPMYTTYAGDTSGVAPDIGSDGTITWNLGTISPGTDLAFMVTLNVTDTAPTGSGVIPDNCAGIATTSPGDSNPGNDWSCTGPIDVSTDDVEIGVNKWPNPNDPAPGQEMEYTLQVCNNRGAAAGPIWLTDTLPLSTTLIDWWPENWQNNYWTEVSRAGGQLILVAPGLSGNMCDQLRLRLLVDAGVPLFTRLTNSMAVAIAGDVDLSNNQLAETGARTSSPRTDLNVSKNFNSGQLVPGGWINYHLHYRNQGNSAVHAWITDTLPANTAYQPGSAREMNGGPAFPPSSVTSQTVVWDLGTIGVNAEYGLDFSIDVSSALTPTTVLTNCATIGLAAPDDTPWDNTACDAETINDHGPNLRVIKYGGWDKGSSEWLRYDAQFMNIGDQQIDNVWVTDTLPVSTSWGGWNMDFDWGRVISNVQSSHDLRLEFSTLYAGDSGWLHFNDLHLDDWTIRPQGYTNTIEIDTPVGDVNPADNLFQVVSLNAEVNLVELRVHANRIDMWGKAQPNSTLMIATASTVITQSVDNWGNWNIYQEGSSIEAGDTVTVTAGDATMPVVIHVPAPFDVQADSITDRVWGQIDSLDHQLIEVALYDYLDKNAQTDSSGNFSRTFADVPRGGRGEVRYRTTIDQADVVFHRDYQSPDLILTVGYRDDWAETRYAPGHTIWITVTDDVGSVKATMIDTTAEVPWWGGDTGFSTNMGTWSPQQPDIAIGDWVYGEIDTGYTASVHIGQINGNLDTVNDRLTGTVVVTWFTDLLNANCWVDGTNDTNRDFTVDPAGGSYACDFAPYDLKPGDNVGVRYEEPDGDWVRNDFRAPAANFWVNKWREGGGDVAPGGSVVYVLEYTNGGDAAGDAILTDTLPANTTYITDSSGLPATVSSGVITWNLGTVLPTGIPHRFYLVLSNSASAGDTLHNVLDIGTAYDQDWNNNHAEADVNVSAGQPDLYIKKDSQPGDPTSGQLFRYNLQYGNNGSVASGPVWLTDTLPASTTFVSWQSQNGYSLWTPIITDGEQIVFYAPSIPANWGDQIFLTLELDDAVAWGTQLTNTVEITTTDEANPSDNIFTNDWTYVNGPRFNASLDKNWRSGTLIPGGTIDYWVSYNNNGNSIMHGTRLTDTLPANTTFITAYLDLGWGIRQPFPPVQTIGNQVVWDLGDLPVNYDQGFDVQLMISPTVSVGTIITNCATIAISDMEDDPYDNTRCEAETVRSAGPNLRVTKFARWQGQNQIRYDVRIENIGTTTINNVNITDTLPISASLNWWNTNFWEQQSSSPDNNQPITLTLNRLEPNWTTWLYAEINLPSVPNGTFFTNTVEITTPPDDVNPADNIDVNVLGTGPDLSIEKRLTGGTPQPGQLVTYTLHYKNDSQWPLNGNEWITDVLPSGTEFVSALQRLCGPGNYFCDRSPDTNDGTTIAWNNGQQCNGCWNDFIVTLRVTDTAKFGDVLTNTAQIASDDPANDVEPYTNNNISTVVLSVVNPKFVVGKVYQGNRVAGTVLTYTLTATNQGNTTGTNVQLIDWTPSWFNYGGGGSYSAGLVTWTIPSINPNNGTATRWFSGTLACTASAIVTNQSYRVSSSDQGVTSTDGISVSFLIAAPTITASIIHSPSPMLVSNTMRFTATTGTYGTPLTYAWNFGDGQTGSGLTASHVYTHAGSYTAIFTATDACNFTRVQTSTITVNAPTLVANFIQSASTIIVSSTVRFTDTSTTNGPSIAAWRWNFGDGGFSAVRHPTHTYTIVGNYTVTLIITDSLGYTATRRVVNAISVQPACTSLTNVTFTFSPIKPLIHTSVSFTATIAPVGATTPITYEWSFGDGSVVTTTIPTIQHAYHVSGTKTINLDTSNLCTSIDVSAQQSITIDLYRVFLPLAMKNS